jgi:AhpD family alkylhydroperoxidase
MDGTMIQQALQEYKEGLGEFARHLPQVAEEYMRFTAACFAEGELSQKVKHLIGVALGVYTNDEYCIVYHTKGAVDLGATDQEVLEAAAVTGAFAGGLGMSQTVTLVQQALKEFRKQPRH